MKNTLLLVALIGFIALSAVAMRTYRQANEGLQLYEAYFDPAPRQGYGSQRSLAVADRSGEASILRQAITYHQQQRYDHAVVAFRAYLEGADQPNDANVLLLAATAANATGNYTEGAEWLARISPDDGTSFFDATWYAALLDLRKEDKQGALTKLRRLASSPQRPVYPVQELMNRLREG